MKGSAIRSTDNMKKLTLLFLMLPFWGLAQTDSLQYIIDKYVVDGKIVTYINSVDLPNKKQDEIRTIAVKQLSSNSRLSIIQASISENQIEGSFTEMVLEYKKYGMKKANTGMWVFYPISGNFTMQFKDGKYRTIIKAVKSVVSPEIIFSFNGNFVNKGILRNLDDNASRRAYYVFGRNMDDLFDISKATKSDW